MKLSVLTIFPEMFEMFWDHGIIRRAIAGGVIDADTVNIRDHAEDRHRTTDDRPYGGGAGMVMMPAPLSAAMDSARGRNPDAVRVLTTPRGKPFNQQLAATLATASGLILVCGRYEGIDERFIEAHIDIEVSLGDFVLTGGELAAMVIMDAVVRLLPGALGNTDSAEQDSFSDHLLEHAHYTRPARYRDADVPEVLLSGHHGEIAQWRFDTAVARTVINRPDLMKNRSLSDAERAALTNWRQIIDDILDSTH